MPGVRLLSGSLEKGHYYPHSKAIQRQLSAEELSAYHPFTSPGEGAGEDHQSEIDEDSGRPALIAGKPGWLSGQAINAGPTL